MKRLILILSVVALGIGSANAALVLQNGSFESPGYDISITSGSTVESWRARNTTAYISDPALGPDPMDGDYLLALNINGGGQAYQFVGTTVAGETELTVTAKFGRRSDGAAGVATVAFFGFYNIWGDALGAQTIVGVADGDGWIVGTNTLTGIAVGTDIYVGIKGWNSPDVDPMMHIDDVQLSVIPAPATLVLVCVCGAGLLLVRKRFLI